MRTKGFARSRCLPVTRQVNRFVPAPESEVPGELPRFSELSAFLKRHHSAVQAKVELDGVTYNATVYEPREPDDLAYALVGEDGLPEAKPSIAQLTTGYLRAFLEKVIELVSFSEPFPPTHRSYLQTEFIAPRFVIWDTSTLQTGPTLRWPDIRARARVVIFGAPGVGKTTCLRRLALDDAKSDHRREGRLPVYLQLRTLVNTDSLADLWRDTLVSEGLVSVPAEADTLANSGRVVLLLDGLDEVKPEIRPRVAAEVYELARRLPDLGIVIATRQSNDHWRFPGFLHVELQPFAVEDVAEWLRRRLGRLGRPHVSEALLRLTSERGLSEISRNPLMLALCAGSLERTRALPERRTEVVLRYVDALLEDWDTARGVSRHTAPWFLKERKMETLCRTAFRLCVEERSAFAADEFISWEAAWQRPARAQEALHLLWSETGICTPAAAQSDSWHFVHQTLRDVLAAKYLVDRTDDALASLAHTPTTRAFESLWPLACELTQDATHLIGMLMEDGRFDELHRAALLSEALTSRLALQRDTFWQAVSSLDRILSNYATEVITTLDVIADEQWSLQLSCTRKDQKDAAVFLLKIGAIIRTLTIGVATEPRRDIADYWITSEQPLLRSIAKRMLVSCEVQSAFNSDERVLSMKGRPAAV